jgi:hypothetical protein
MPQRRPNVPSAVELLESRRLFSFAPANINLTGILATMEPSAPPTITASGNQTAAAIAIDPASPSHLFAVANMDTGQGLLVAASADGGQTWAPRVIANAADALPPAFGQADAAFDAAGNLFLTYLNSSRNRIEVLLSADGGANFTVVGQFSGNVAHPKVAAGGASVWVAFDRNNAVATTRANDATPFAPFMTIARVVPGSVGGTLADLAVEAAAPAGTPQVIPPGEAAIAFQKAVTRTREGIYVSLRAPVGASTVFSKPRLAATDHLGNHDLLPAQPTAAIDAGAQIAFANPGDPTFGNRLYLVYADAASQAPPAMRGASVAQDTNIFLSYADWPLTNWSKPAAIGAAGAAPGSRFLPRLSIDASASNATSDVAVVAWYDTSLDLGTGGPTDTDGVPNDDAEYAISLLTPNATGMQAGAAQVISALPSNERDAMNAAGYGDALAFYNGVVLPFWSDNSNSTNDNPSGTLRDFNAYTNAPLASSGFPT